MSNKQQTLRELSDTHFRTGNQDVVLQIGAMRDTEIAALSLKDKIEIEDIEKLDRIGRFTIAQSLFSKCTDKCRNVLLNDEHPHVRSAASQQLASMAMQVS
ncbi:hypothetical protein AB4455_12240 [Vibrio sp. 10N.261.46.E12]|uniref:hypothetical protein n=1 Tax=unclassified Vibrio TaxID=2614977 RepID=UPI000976DB06|nr:MULTISPECIES: hypothetical protein [unclassified Vibrio]OMO34207.1 hypothetical protein BH584_13390 [Vibrio sp. 10N.261.45.E1]PMJ33143.1 hypothetical protein BCU27_25205 [Vibrio sp. 10N.286.45.B6]PML86366.1 hypothetical protein BCT66_14340 [Vibrio sp. 10N.261.49.E11]PMM77482.1 hypothetical protein BCT48_23780 [Vibrio sp. 10N.261.46.F12]PMM90616.1 hypothetical protein BCT46_03335 [Vibrio sp. 10N.261.46.E8]